MASTRPRPSDRDEHRRHVIEDVEWLTDCGESPDHIAHRLGYANPTTLADVLTRWGRPSLARRLTRTETAA